MRPTERPAPAGFLEAHIADHPWLRTTPGDPNTDYPLVDFLDDQRRVAAVAKHRDLADRDTLPTVDGCMRIVHADLLCEALDLPEVARAFGRKYRGEAGPARLQRFALVVDFLHERAAEVVDCGVAQEEAASLAVRDDLLRYLLGYPVEPDARELPPGIFARFLDEWAHRWY